MRVLIPCWRCVVGGFSLACGRVEGGALSERAFHVVWAGAVVGRGVDVRVGKGWWRCLRFVPVHGTRWGFPTFAVLGYGWVRCGGVSAPWRDFFLDVRAGKVWDSDKQGGFLMGVNCTSGQIPLRFAFDCRQTFRGIPWADFSRLRVRVKITCG